jgi:hypothetical protein
MPFGENALWDSKRVTVSAVERITLYVIHWQQMQWHLPEAQRTARCNAAAPVSTSPSKDFRLSLLISVKNGWIKAGSPGLL